VVVAVAARAANCQQQRVPAGGTIEYHWQAKVVDKIGPFMGLRLTTSDQGS
jgi:hypothetical protein